MSTPDRTLLSDVQRVVLAGGPGNRQPWRTAQHFVLEFPVDARVPRFLELLKDKGLWPTPAGQGGCLAAAQASLGFSRRGLEHAQVPSLAMSLFAAKAPAFWVGASARGPTHAGAHGASAPGQWDGSTFRFDKPDAVFSLHADDAAQIDAARQGLDDAAHETGVLVTPLPRAAWIYDDRGHTRVYFGYRDNLSKVGIQGWSSERTLGQLKPLSRHAVGEFVLGHAQNSGANPWLARGGVVLPEGLRAFVRNGSFGVVQQIAQDVAAFEALVQRAVEHAKGAVDDRFIMAKLCGRDTEGLPAGSRQGTTPDADHDYAGDQQAFGCPFGAHARRMNPRDTQQRAHTMARPILRRGMPYTDGSDGSVGLLGLFFCASIEDQYEHLVGQWGNRAPLGEEDLGTSRDPLIGTHQPGDGPFVIPMGKARPPIVLRDLPTLTRTRGTAYLFFPSLTALQQMARGLVFPFTETVERP
jgi:deferrochelatase/peroxidase EfeB